MITCSYCGTNYQEYQANCDNCGAVLPASPEKRAVSTIEALQPVLQQPPLPPRELPANYLWRMMFSDGWGIVGFIFALIGAIFIPIGILMIIAIVTILTGIPFAALGLVMLFGGGAILYWRVKQNQLLGKVLREGLAVLGEIDDLQQNLSVQINGRSPWQIRYHFRIHLVEYEGKRTTLSPPDWSFAPGAKVYVLYLVENPDFNTIYPHPDISIVNPSA